MDPLLVGHIPRDSIRPSVSLVLLGRLALSASVCWVPPKTHHLDLSSAKSGCAGIAAAYESSTSAWDNLQCIRASELASLAVAWEQPMGCSRSVFMVVTENRAPLLSHAGGLLVFLPRCDLVVVVARRIRIISNRPVYQRLGASCVIWQNEFRGPIAT